MRWLLLAMVACSKGAPKRDDAAVIAAKPIDAATLIDAARPAAVLDKYEVTVAEYRACTEASVCPQTSRGVEIFGKDRKVAMGGVTFYEARAYCAWKGKRLPTPAEWKHAAYGDDARKYPWGNEPPTCERVHFDDCKPDGPVAPGGRPSGASPSGNEDMLGNVSEWTDPGALAFTSACITKPRDKVPLLGGYFASGIDYYGFSRDDTTMSDQSTWVDNSDQGMRCAQGDSAHPIATTDPLLTAKTWNVVAFKTASPAIAEVTARCKRGEQATYLARDNEWLVAGTAPSDRTIEAPKDLVRVVGIATCGDVDETTRLTAKAGNQTWRLRYPSALGVYQLWLAPGTFLSLDIECTRPPSRGECSFGMMTTPTQRFRVPTGPASGIEGPSLEAHGGMTCD